MSNIPSIALIPSAYKSGKVYSVLPTDGSGDLNFARASEATRVNENGLIETVGSNVPRIDYKDGGCPKLLLEPTMTNTITHSNDFNNASWLKTNLNITKDIEIAPNGLLNASKILQTVSGGYARINTTLTGSETFSLFAKKGDLTDLKLFLGGDYSYFDLENGVVLFASGSNFVSSNIESFNNDWYRCSITSSYSGGSSIRFQGTNGTDDNSLGYVYAYGAQLEAGSYATSYIPTNGSTVTREAETASKSGLSSYINSQEGVLYFECKALENSGLNRAISLNDGTQDNRIMFYFTTASNTVGLLYEVNNGTPVILTDNSLTITNTNKYAISFNSTETCLFANGLKLITLPTNPNFNANILASLSFNSGVGGSPFYGKVKDLRVYNQVLTDLELEEMTGFKSFVQMANQLNYTVI